MKLSPRPTRRAAVILAAALLTPAALAACGSSGKSGSSSPSSAQGATTKVGVAVTGGFGDKPTLTVPNKPAPTALSTDVLKQGDGPTVASGQTLVVNYLGETWAPKDGKPNVFDNSYDRKQVAGFPIGVKAVIPGWDKTLVGQKLGSRLLLTVPPADGYGSDASSQLNKDTLLFVVDLVAVYDKATTAQGQPAGALPAGLPQIKSESGAVPAVTSVKGVDASAKTAKSGLLLKGSGAAIDTSKSLVFQFLQADAKTGKASGSSWTSGGPQVAPASSVLSLVSALKDQKIGSRAVAVLPASSSAASSVVVVDVIGQN